MSQYWDKKTMSFVALDQDAKRWVTFIEDGEARRHGTDVEHIRPLVANRIGCAPGTIERLRKGRVKGVKAWLYARLRVLMIDELQQEIQRLSNELELARACGVGAGDDEIIAAQASMETTRTLLKAVIK